MKLEERGIKPHWRRLQPAGRWLEGHMCSSWTPVSHTGCVSCPWGQEESPPCGLQKGDSELEIPTSQLGFFCVMCGKMEEILNRNEIFKLSSYPKTAWEREWAVIRKEVRVGSTLNTTRMAYALHSSWQGCFCGTLFIVAMLQFGITRASVRWLVLSHSHSNASFSVGKGRTDWRVAARTSRPSCLKKPSCSQLQHRFRVTCLALLLGVIDLALVLLPSVWRVVFTLIRWRQFSSRGGLGSF